MIEIINLTKKYGNFVALEDFNLAIPDGSIFGLVGINGAGKSTLLRLLSGVMRGEMGEIFIDNEPIFENEKRKREIFFLPDEVFYAVGMTGARMAELYRTFYSFDDEVFNKYIKIYKLDVKAPLRKFSKGMKRQMLVCLAFACCPKYLFLDEVFDGLDPAARMIFKQGLIELTERTGGTVVIASHSLRELEDICDSYALIDGKKIYSSGNLYDSVEKLCKFQMAFDRPISRDELGFDCLSFEASGRIVTVVVRGGKEEWLDKIAKLNPLVVDELPVDFEQFFISEVQRRGEQ